MTWHGQINRTIWELSEAQKKNPDSPRYRRELLRAQFLQNFEHDKAFHVPRDDRTFLFLHDEPGPVVLLLHGATGTPAEFRELGNYLYQHGISSYCPRLSRAAVRDREASWESWVTQSEIALEAVTTCSSLAFVCGLSLGGAVSMILANRAPVRGVVLLAPALFPRLSLKARFLQVTRVVTPTVFYHFAGWNGEILKAMDFSRRNAQEIKQPLLALQAEDDNRLSSRGLRFVRRHARNSDSEIKLLPEGSHVLTRGAAKNEVFQMVAAFVERNSKDGGWTAKQGGSAPETPDAGDAPDDHSPDDTESRSDRS